MLDVTPVIVAELEQLAAAPAREPDWGDVLARAKSDRAPSPRRTRRLFVLVAAGAVAAAVVAVALAAVFGGFSAWLTGEPGKPASSQAQAAFDRSIRTWQGFPRSTELRELAKTSVGNVHYTLYGFRGAGSLCLRLVVTGTLSGTELACAPLSELRARRSPALVLASDLTLGTSGKIVSQGPLSLPASRVAVSFGVVADGVNRIEVAHQTPAPTRTIVSDDAFLAVSPGLSPFNATTRITAFAGQAHATVPFAQQPTPYTYNRAVPLSMPSPTGPAMVQRVVKGGAIGWFARREPRGQAVPANVHHIVGVMPDVIFARMLAPNPAAPERVVVSIRPAGHAYFGGRLHNNRQVCAELVGGRYSGGGCWPAGRLFTTAPFAWWVADQTGGQVVTISGVASDQVARMTLFSATGNKQPVPLHDNTYLAVGTLADYPLRLVAYDQDDRVIGVETFKGAHAFPAGPAPAPGAPWHRVLSNKAGTVYTVRSTSGGTCVGFREASAATFACDQHLDPNTLSLFTGTDDKNSFILGRTGSHITRITIRLRRGQTITAKPVQGYLLLRLPHTTRDPSAGVAEVRGFDKTGHVVAHETFRR